MSPDIRYSFFLADERHPATPDLPIWNNRIPLNRNHSHHDASITYGEFFTAVKNFLDTHYNAIDAELSARLQQPPAQNDISGFQIFLEKHGEFYHPCRIEFETCSRIKFQPMVLNCALSNIGKRFIHHEAEVLNRLDKENHTDRIPKIYVQGQSEASNGFDILMFLGNWFSGYHEFHLKENEQTKQNILRVWDPDNPDRYLTQEETLEVYRQASNILTSFYRLETGEQVCLWHHAAGDFIVQSRHHPLDVKLITVRHYAPLIDADIANSDSILGALLLFLIHTSIQMRIDRYDGVGDLVWSDDSAVKGTVSGFLESLKTKQTIHLIPDTISAFRYFTASLPNQAFFQIAEALMDSYPPPETALIKRHLTDHVHSLYLQLKNALH